MGLRPPLLAAYSASRQPLPSWPDRPRESHGRRRCCTGCGRVAVPQSSRTVFLRRDPVLARHGGQSHPVRQAVDRQVPAALPAASIPCKDRRNAPAGRAWPAEEEQITAARPARSIVPCRSPEDPMAKPSAPRAPSTRKRMFWTVLVTVIVFGGVFAAWAAMQSMMNAFFDDMPQPPVSVATCDARAERWSGRLEAVGTLVA